MSIIIDGTNGISDIDGTASTPAIRGTDANTGIFFPAADTVAISEGGVESARFNSSGNLQLVNSLSVGNATPTTSGAGITFPATQSASTDANTLDDYEEGTFTPTFASSSGSITTYSSTGVYTKIGNIVTIQVSFTVSNKGTASGDASITGLPFTSKNVTGRPAIGLARENANTGQTYQGFITSNGTTAGLQSLSGGNLTWTNGDVFTFAATYQTA